MFSRSVVSQSEMFLVTLLLLLLLACVVDAERCNDERRMCDQLSDRRSFCLASVDLHWACPGVTDHVRRRVERLSRLQLTCLLPGTPHLRSLSLSLSLCVCVCVSVDLYR